VTSPVADSFFSGVSCPSSTWCMAVGQTGSQTLAQRYSPPA
jgi:hypothetical protein